MKKTLLIATTLLTLSAAAADKGYGLDPNGRPNAVAAARDEGCAIDPFGGKRGCAMDPNGYAGTVDPNGRPKATAADAGCGIDPNGRPRA